MLHSMSGWYLPHFNSSWCMFCLSCRTSEPKSIYFQFHGSYCRPMFLLFWQGSRTNTFDTWDTWKDDNAVTGLEEPLPQDWCIFCCHRCIVIFSFTKFVREKLQSQCCLRRQKVCVSPHLRVLGLRRSCQAKQHRLNRPKACRHWIESLDSFVRKNIQGLLLINF